MASTPFSLEGQTVLVSGAGRGMGFEAAKLIAACGATVALTARTESQVNDAAAAIRADGGNAHAFSADVSEIAAHDDLIDRVETACGELTALVNIAGVSPFFARAERITPEQYDQVMGINERGTFFLTQAVAKRWIERSVGGSVVTVSSIAARVGLPRFSVYAMSRAAVEAMTKSMAAEWAAALDPPIRLNVVAPGFVETQFTEEVPGWYEQKTKDHTAMRRWGSSGEMAGAIAFLLSDEARYITGTVIEVSGGYGLWSLDPAPKS